MKPKVASILKHIIDSLFVIAMTVIVVLVVWMFAESHIDKSIKFLSEVAPLLLIISFALISAFLGWIFPREMRASVLSIRLWPKHWGLAIRGLIGAITTIVLAKQFRLLEVEYEQVIEIGLLIAIVESLVLLVGWGTAKLHLWFHESSRNNARNHQTGDEPIHRLKDNLFPEYEITARRILDRLELDKDADLKGPNIAIVGPYGSGKTSLCNIVEDICQAEKLRFCRFEAWQFLTADAAVRGLLDEIIRTVQGLVDCSAVGSLPDKYLDALRVCPNGWLGMIGTFLSKRLSTEDVILVLQDVLLRIDKRIIVFVDDFDRLESNSREMQDAVAAALNQLQNLTNVQYVLCVGPMHEGKGADLLKLTRFQEFMPEVSNLDIIKKLRSMRDEVITE